jgi:AcrR family transcriptional regulator
MFKTVVIGHSKSLDSAKEFPLIPESGNGRKAQIARLATELFHRKGYAATSMRELASVSGIEAPSLYNHFSSKETLLHEICFAMADAFVVTARRIAAMDLTVSERLALAIREHLRLLYSDREAVGVFVNEWRHLSEPSLQAFKNLRLNYEQFFAGLFREGMDKGVFVQGDPLWLSRQLLLLMNGSVHSITRPDEQTLTLLADRFLDLWMNGISRKSLTLANFKIHSASIHPEQAQ